MNFIFISPQFPPIYWNFCDRLKERGITVLGIGDTPYSLLEENTKNALDEYYYVPNLEDYDEVFRAVSFFSFKYGKIDWLESNNEYWLEQDARLRTEFHITTGIMEDQVDRMKNKSVMKKFYEKAGVPCARWHLVSTLPKAKEFIKKVGYPVVIKPDNGVGASHTLKISNDCELEAFYQQTHHIQYIMEEFVYGDIISYDGVCDSKGEILFEVSHHFTTSIMDIVNSKDHLYYYTEKEIPDDLRVIGRKVMKAFQVKQRFFHLEFFRLLEPHEGLGETGDIVALEANMRPPGGYTPDMINFSQNTDVYTIWADAMLYDKCFLPISKDKKYAIYVARRDGRNYLHSHEEILEKYDKEIVMETRMPDVLSDAMGNQMYIALMDTIEQMNEFILFIHQ